MDVIQLYVDIYELMTLHRLDCGKLEAAHVEHDSTEASFSWQQSQSDRRRAPQVLIHNTSVSSTFKASTATTTDRCRENWDGARPSLQIIKQAKNTEHFN
jgi:hypothetical protein